MGQKLALIVGNTDYNDPRFSTLSTPAEDVSSLAALLRDPAIGGFDILEPLINQEEKVVSRSVEKFFSKKQHDDLLLFYFSGHGMLDEEGLLYFALKDTDFEIPRSSSLSADFVREAMDRTRSERVVLILDCCHSGAFARGQMGPKGVAGGSVGTKNTFEPKNGRGRWVLTATDATQYAWEGTKLVGTASALPGTSVFTHCLVEGLRQGEADVDQDGLVSVRDLSNYIYSQMTKQDLKQTPCLWSYKEQGNLFIASNPRSVLPRDLLDTIKSPFPNIRYEAVELLKQHADSSDQGVAVQAKNALTRLITDDSRRVSRAAARAMGTRTESENFRQGRFENLRPPEVVIGPQDDGWQDKISKTFRLSRLSTKQSFQTTYSKIQDVFDSVSDAIRQHKTLVFRIEISLVALLAGIATWHYAPPYLNGGKGHGAAVSVSTAAKPADSTPMPVTPAITPIAPDAKPPVENPAVMPPAPLQISELVMRTYLIHEVKPVYPDAAKKANLQGQVILQALIDKDGLVKQITTLNGRPILAKALTDAAYQWRYRPYPNLNNPMPVETRITYRFQLALVQPPNPATAQQGIVLAANITPYIGNTGLPSGTKIYTRNDSGVTVPQRISGSPPPYTKQARKNQVQGVVVLQILVKPDGTVGLAKLIHGLEIGLNQSALNTVRNWRFAPATKNGKPVPVWADVFIDFVLPDPSS